MSFPWFLGSRNLFQNFKWRLDLCTVQDLMYCKVQFFLNVNYRHATCLFHGFGGKETHFWTSNDVYVYVLHSAVQFCVVMYSKVQFFTKLLNMGMLYVFSMIFGAKNLISELKLTLRFMYCIVLYNFVP